MWNSDSGGTNVSSGHLLHCQVLKTHNPGVQMVLHLCISFILKCHLSIVSPVPDYVKATVETVLKIHETEDDGDVLAFLTGQVSEQVLTNIQSLFIVLGLTDSKVKPVLCIYLLCGQPSFFVLSLLVFLLLYS